MINVTNVSKAFAGIKAVDNLSFEVNEGEILGLLGPNGAGKTTTMRIMSGYLFPDEGNVILNGISICDNPVEAQKLIGYLPENNPLYKDMLVCDVIDYSCDLKELTGAERKEAINFAVNAVNISSVFYRPVSELSKGYRQRVGIAIALLHRPKILIMDEPTEGLDPNQRVEIRNLIKTLALDHTIIISTHVMQEVEALCTRTVIVNKGAKVADASVDDLKKGNAGEKTILVSIEGQNVSELITKLVGVLRVDLATAGGITSGSLIVEATNQIQPSISKLVRENGWIIWRLSEEKLKLEDIFKELTK